MSQQQTNETLRQIQNNAILIRQSEKNNQKYDEILNSIDAEIRNKFLYISASFESSSAHLDPQEILLNDFSDSHQDKVSQTESFRVEVIELVAQQENLGKNWLQAFKDALSSESIQNKLQEFKDNISAAVVKLGNKIAALPEEIATKAVMTTVPF